MAEYRNGHNGKNGRVPDGSPPWPLVRSDYAIRFRRSLPSTTAALNRTVREIMKLARKCGCTDDRVDLEIALREALANALIHGNGKEVSKRIFVRCYAAPQSAMLILIRDQGAGFEPDEIPDPRDDDRRHLEHGRGVLLMRALMDYVEYRKRGREVVMYKSCANVAKP